MSAPEHDEPTQYVVNRPVYGLAKFDSDYKEVQNYSYKVRVLKMRAKCYQKCAWTTLLNVLCSLVPFYKLLRKYYQKKYIIWDLVAGLTMGIFHIPQGMAYGILAGVKPINGLYTSFFPVLIYIFLGTSHHLSLGTFSLMSLMMAEPVERLSENFRPIVEPNATSNVSMGNSSSGIPSAEDQLAMWRLQIAICTTFTAGALQFLMGVLQLGFLTIYLSDALVSGFTTGAAFHVMTSQVSTVFGYKVPRYTTYRKIVMTYYEIFRNITKTNIATFITSVICILILVFTKEVINPRVKKKIKAPLPIELILVILGTVISYFGQFNERFGVQIVGDIPPGLPPPLVPQFDIFLEIISDAVAMAIVGFAVSASLAKIFSQKFHYKVDYSQELRALGLSNVFGSFFQCHFASGALARTSVVVDVGMKSQISSIISCILMLIVLLVIGPLFKTVPNCVFSAIIVVSLKGMFLQFNDLKMLWKISIYDFLIWLVAFLFTVFFDVTIGLLVGFGFALLTTIFRTQNPKSRVMGLIADTDIYKDVTVYPQAKEIPGIKIFRFDGPLYFANAETFRKMLYKKTGVLPHDISLAVDTVNDDEAAINQSENGPTQEEMETNEPSTDSKLRMRTPNHDADGTQRKSAADDEPIHHVIIDCSTWAYIDSVGVRVLKEVISAYRACSIVVLLAVCKADVREMFVRTQLYETMDKDYMYITLHDAVLDALADRSHQLRPEIVISKGDSEDLELRTTKL